MNQCLRILVAEILSNCNARVFKFKDLKSVQQFGSSIFEKLLVFFFVSDLIGPDKIQSRENSKDSGGFG